MLIKIGRVPVVLVGAAILGMIGMCGPTYAAFETTNADSHAISAPQPALSAAPALPSTPVMTTAPAFTLPPTPTAAAVEKPTPTLPALTVRSTPLSAQEPRPTPVAESGIPPFILASLIIACVFLALLALVMTIKAVRGKTNKDAGQSQSKNEALGAVAPTTLESVGQAAVTTASQVALDPIYASGKRLLDALYQAEADVDAFIRYIGNTTEQDSATKPMHIIESWRETILDGSKGLLELFESKGWTIEISAVVQAHSIGQAAERIMNHAAFFTSILYLQEKQDSGIFHWSRLIPNAVATVHWVNQTTLYMTRFKEKPILQISLSKSIPALPQEPAAQDTAPSRDDFLSRAVRQAARSC